jgi:hypothetical protein
MLGYIISDKDKINVENIINGASSKEYIKVL